MNYNKGRKIKKIYLAAPWFNEQQDELEKFAYKALTEAGFEVFRPREESLVKPTDPHSVRQAGFESNKLGIMRCDAVLSITTGKDMGTLFDTGFAHAHGKPIIYFAPGLKNGFNLMLAMSAVGVITSKDLFKEDLSKIVSNYAQGDEYRFSGEIE